MSSVTSRCDSIGDSSGFSKSKPFVKGPLYVRYDERWILCQAEVTHTKLNISVVHLESAMMDLNPFHHRRRRSSHSFDESSTVSDMQSAFSSKGSVPNMMRKGAAGAGAAGGHPLSSSPTSSSRTPLSLNNEQADLQERELYGLRITSPPPQKIHGGASTPSRNHNNSSNRHPLNRSVDVTKICEVKLLNFLHYFDKFTFEVVCKRSSRVRSKLSHLSQPAHFGQSVNETVGECHGDRYEVLTFKAPNEKALFEWVDGIEDAVDPVEQLLKNVVQQMPESVTGDSPWRPELPVYGQVKACFGPSSRTPGMTSFQGIPYNPTGSNMVGRKVANTNTTFSGGGSTVGGLTVTAATSTTQSSTPRHRYSGVFLN